MENKKLVLKEGPCAKKLHSNKMKPHTHNLFVAQKDIQKITELKEFMSKQIDGNTSRPSLSNSAATSGRNDEGSNTQSCNMCNKIKHCVITKNEMSLESEVGQPISNHTKNRNMNEEGSINGPTQCTKHSRKKTSYSINDDDIRLNPKPYKTLPDGIVSFNTSCIEHNSHLYEPCKINRPPPWLSFAMNGLDFDNGSLLGQPHHSNYSGNSMSITLPENTVQCKVPHFISAVDTVCSANKGYDEENGLGLLDLPYEQVLPIYQFCSIDDLKNLACTSKSFYYLLTELLWEVIEIPSGVFADKSLTRKNLKNLKYTNNLRIRKTSPNVNLDLLVSNYTHVLEHCNSSKLVSLKVDGCLTDKGIIVTCNLLTNLKFITLVDCDNITEDGWKSLVGLHHLRSVFLDKCSISKNSFSYIVNMLSVQEIKVRRHCKLTTDDILKPLSCSSRLKEIGVSNTGVMEHKYLENNLNLTELIIQYSRVSDETMKVIGTLKHLKTVYIVSCYGYTQAAIRYLSELTQLERFNLTCNNIEDKKFLPLSKLTSLKELELSYSSKLSNIGMSSVLSIISITHLSLDGCEGVTNKALSDIGKLNTLVELSISGCPLVTHSGVYYISQLPKLEKLSLGYCKKITDLALMYVGNISSLKQLDIKGCWLISDSGVAHLEKLRSLEELDLNMASPNESSFQKLSVSMRYSVGDTLVNKLSVGFDRADITDDGLSSFQGMPLRHLDIEKCVQITDQGLFYISHITTLVELNISSCMKLSDIGMYYIRKLIFLQKLEISCTPITDGGLSYLSQSLKFLREVGIGYCWNITNTGVKDLCCLPSLRVVALNDCANIDFDKLPSYPSIMFHMIDADNTPRSRFPSDMANLENLENLE